MDFLGTMKALDNQNKATPIILTNDKTGQLELWLFKENNGNYDYKYIKTCKTTLLDLIKEEGGDKTC